MQFLNFYFVRVPVDIFFQLLCACNVAWEMANF
jgi:hypothetical protein